MPAAVRRCARALPARPAPMIQTWVRNEARGAFKSSRSISNETSQAKVGILSSQ